MDRLKVPPKIKALWDRHKFVLLIVLLGLVLMALPERTQEAPHPLTPTTPANTFPEEDLAASLEKILSQIHGAGEVRVLLSEETGVQTVFQTDTDSQENTQGTSVRVETVIISQGSGMQNGLIVQTNPGTYRGAIVLCQGADDPVIKLQITEAVAKCTGLGTDRISVLKLKT